MARERELEILKRQHDEAAERMEHVSEVLQLLRTVPDDKAHQLFSFIRSADDPMKAVLSLRYSLFRSSALSDHATARAMLPPTRTGLEYELQMLFPTSYLVLSPLDLHDTDLLLPKTQSLQPVNGSHVKINGSLSAAKSAIGAVAHDAPAGPAVCDMRLKLLQIGHWTRVQISSRQAALLISRYLETDHPMLGWFDADLFIADLVYQRNDYCSSLLANSVLFCACVGCCSPVQLPELTDLAAIVLFGGQADGRLESSVLRRSESPMGRSKEA